MIRTVKEGGVVLICRNILSVLNFSEINQIPTSRFTLGAKLRPKKKIIYDGYSLKISFKLQEIPGNNGSFLSVLFKHTFCRRKCIWKYTIYLQYMSCVFPSKKKYFLSKLL